MELMIVLYLSRLYIFKVLDASRKRRSAEFFYILQ